MMFSRQPFPASRRSRPLRWLAVLGAMAMLTACSSVPSHNPDTAGGASGVTVYGTADGGIGRTRR